MFFLSYHSSGSQRGGPGSSKVDKVSQGQDFLTVLRSSISIISPVLHINNPEHGTHIFLRNVGTYKTARRHHPEDLIQLLNGKTDVLNFAMYVNENTNLDYLYFCLLECFFTVKLTKTKNENSHERLFIIGRHIGHPQHQFSFSTAAVFIQFIGLASTKMLSGREWSNSINSHVCSSETRMRVSD